MSFAGWAVVRGELEGEAAGGGPEPGSVYVAGGRAKKTVEPRARRALAGGRGRFMS